MLNPDLTYSPPQSGSEDWDAWHQVFTILSADGLKPIPVSIDYVNYMMTYTTATNMNYGAQVGASFVMLILLVVLSPSLKVVKTLKGINIASLVVSIIRFCMLPSSVFGNMDDFYSTFSKNYSRVTAGETSAVVVINLLGFVQSLLIQAAFMLQTWTVVKIWHSQALRCLALAFSTLVALVTLFFYFYVMVQRNMSAVRNVDATVSTWAEDGMHATTAISNCYFCMLFGFRLALHMYQSRTLLPPIEGSTLTAMEALVVTNAVLMIFPCIFIGLQYIRMHNFEAGSLAHTLIVLGLPFGTLIAQQIARGQFLAPSNIAPDETANNGFEGSSAPTMSSGKNLLSKASAGTGTAVNAAFDGVGRNSLSLPMTNKPQRATDKYDNYFNSAASFDTPGIKTNITSSANTLLNK